MAKEAKEERPMSIVERMARQYKFEPAEFQRVVKKTCMPSGATDEEFLLFLAAANELELNPLTREIYAFARPQGGGIQHIIAADGWYKKANQHPANNGIQCRETFSESGQLVSCTATLHRKDRDYPTVVTEYLKENKRNTDSWNNRPVRMLRHRAISQGVRICYGFAGVMDEEEYLKWVETTPVRATVGESTLDEVADDIPASEPPKSKLKLVPPNEEPKPESPKEDPFLDLEQQNLVERLIINGGWPSKAIGEVLLVHAGVNSTDQIKLSQLEGVIERLTKAAANKKAASKENRPE